MSQSLPSAFSFSLLLYSWYRREKGARGIIAATVGLGSKKKKPTVYVLGRLLNLLPLELLSLSV